MPDISAALIPAIAALVGAFLGSIGRPIAEDRVARWRERRSADAERTNRERARIEHVINLLADLSYGETTPRWNSAQGQITSATAAVNDEQLTERVGRYMSSGTEGTLTDAKWRAGELLREYDEASARQ